MLLSEAIALRLSDIMSDKNITAYSLSVKSGISRSTISYILNGQTLNITSVVITKICAALDISLKDFFDSPYFDNISFES